MDVGHVLADRTLRQPHKLPHATAWTESKAVTPMLLGGAEQSGWLCKGLVGESESRTLSDINHSRILYDPHPRILETKAKINKWGLMKLKIFAQRRKL